MNKDCRKFYQSISESCEIQVIKDGSIPVKLTKLLKEEQKLHLTLEAKNATEVKKIHKLALINGGLCDGEPRVRSFNGKFSAYVIDPDGNRLEVVCSKSK